MFPSKPGEDWANIKLTLSTGNPTANNVKPVLTPYFLTVPEIPSAASNATHVSGRIFGKEDGQPIPDATVSIKGTTINTVTDVNGRYYLNLPYRVTTLSINFIGYQTKDVQITSAEMNIGLSQASQGLAEVAVTERSKSLGYSTESIPIDVNQTENQTNFEYNINNPYSVPDDGKQYIVEINQVNVNATYQYFVAPKLNTDVFLTAQLTNWVKYNFLSGEANLFFEGTYIGKSRIDTHNVTDTLNLAFGVDKNILVTRKLQKENSEKQALSSNKKETRDWVIQIRNRKSSRISILVEDQVPVSQSSSIEVQSLNLSGARPDQITGKISWNLLINSQDEKKLEIKYQVKLPKNQSIIVQ